MRLTIRLTLFEGVDPYGRGSGGDCIEVIEINAPPATFRAMVSAVAREFTETIDAMVDTMNSNTKKEIE